MIEKTSMIAIDVAHSMMMERYGIAQDTEPQENPLYDMSKEETIWKDEYQEEFNREYDKWYTYFSAILGESE